MTSNTSNQSSAAVAGLNLTLEPLESLIKKGLQRKIQNLTEAKTIWTSSSDKTLALQQLFGSPGSTTNDITVEYPYIFLTVNSVTEAENRLHNRMAAMRGMPSVIVDDQKRCFNVRFLAVDTSVSFQYVSNSFKQVERMAAMWLFARKNGWFKFDVQYGRSHFGIGVDLDPNVNLPLREADPEDSPEYLLEASLTLQGFLSFPTLIEQQVANQLHFDFQLSDGTQFWSFDTKKDTSSVQNSETKPQQL